MAEIATGVLHNVGNVLNSVNVSANLLQSQLQHSKLKGLDKAVHLLRTQEADLERFFGQDPRGPEFVDYLAKLSEHLASEQSATLEELKLLTKNVDHIKLIVAAQQGYARVSGILEPTRVGEVVDDALHLQEKALVRDGITVERHYAPAIPEITMDKHKLLQILINLLRNAQSACQGSPQAQKTLRVGVAMEMDRIRISVSDNGVGIPEENLTRIFSHGFTTFKDGHGFGLHTAALAATELGGSLSAASDGVDRGATFTLELPRHPKEEQSRPRI